LLVFLGIQLLSAELKKLNVKSNVDDAQAESCTSEESVQSILRDISESCSVAIEILNDLLLIDKIEEGNLNLDMNSINAKDLIGPCIKNFEVQVINTNTIVYDTIIVYYFLYFQALFSNITLSVDLQALSNVIVNVDATKIAQVFRNVVRFA
jgi:signal transduction histidine kinase